MQIPDQMTDKTSSIGTWLEPLDRLPLECDGLTRVISTLLTRDGVAHQAMAGALLVPGVGDIGLHWWIDLVDGRRVDYRARMWLGGSEKVPHGVFTPGDEVQYSGQPVDAVLDPALFWILSNIHLAVYPTLEDAKKTAAASLPSCTRGLRPIGTIGGR